MHPPPPSSNNILNISMSRTAEINFSVFSNNWMVQYELGKKETREGGQEPISFAEYIKRYTDEDLYCVTGLPK